MRPHQRRLNYWLSLPRLRGYTVLAGRFDSKGLSCCRAGAETHRVLGEHSCAQQIEGRASEDIACAGVCKATRHCEKSRAYHQQAYGDCREEQ